MSRKREEHGNKMRCKKLEIRNKGSNYKGKITSGKKLTSIQKPPKASFEKRNLSTMEIKMKLIEI